MRFDILVSLIYVYVMRLLLSGFATKAAVAHFLFLVCASWRLHHQHDMSFLVSRSPGRLRWMGSQSGDPIPRAHADKVDKVDITSAFSAFTPTLLLFPSLSSSLSSSLYSREFPWCFGGFTIYCTFAGHNSSLLCSPLRPLDLPEVERWL